MKHKLFTTFLLLINIFVVSVDAQQKTISIVLTQPPLPTGITFTKGQQITITASGEMNWYTGGCPESGYCITTPDGYNWAACENDGGFDAPGLSCWSLIGQIGPNGTPFQVGSSFSKPAPASGELYLGVNDNYYPDNTGKWIALIDLPNAITLVDPVSAPSLLDDNHITEAATAADVENQEPYLADLSRGRPVLGVATDGVAQVVIRISAGSVGEQFTLSTMSQCAGLSTPDCIDKYGLLFDPTDPPASIFGDAAGTTQTVTAVPTDNGAMAFAAYRAPLDFVRTAADRNASSRTVGITVTSNLTGAQPDLNVLLVRPPVFLIHGIFSSPQVFFDFIPVINNPSNPLFLLVPLNYSQDIDSQVSSTDPSEIRSSAIVKRNVIGVEYNAPFLLDTVVKVIDDFKDQGPFPNQAPIPVAAVQGDVVAHSLGGLMARGMTHVGSDYPLTPNSDAGFYDDESYGRGYIHKLITLGTPHLGTNFAMRLINGDLNPNDPRQGKLFPNIGGNDCTRIEAGKVGAYNFNSVTINGATYYGASYDLYGDPTQGIESPTIKMLNQSQLLAIPTGLIAATFNASNDSALLAMNGALAQAFCGTRTVAQTPTGPSIQPTGSMSPTCGGQPNCTVKYGDFLADNYSFNAWPNIFNGQPSDALVPLASATFGQDVYWAFPGVVHGPGTVGWLGLVGDWPFLDPHIGFKGPELLDPASMVPVLVLQLLNTSIKDTTSFIQIP